MRVHLDTDFGGDPDDACALSMLLGLADVEIVGITTSLEHLGYRAGCVEHVLQLAGRTGIPVAAGAEQTLTGGRYRPTHDDPRHWPVPVEPRRGKPGAYLDLLASSAADGAVIIAIGGFTNLAMLELARPGSLADAQVFAMNGWFGPAGPGFPQWGEELEFNTQVDTRAAEIVAAATNLTLVPLTVAMRASLKESQLHRLRASGPVGELLANQSEAHRNASGFPELAREHPALPSDLVNFHWDPLTAAIATGWNGASIDKTLLRTELCDGVLRFVAAADGRPHSVATSIDAAGFDEYFFRAIDRLNRASNQEIATGS